MKHFVLWGILYALLISPALGQTGERSGSSNGGGIKDLSGLSVKTPRIRAVHTEDLNLVGGTMWLQSMDPFLAFKMGKDLSQREFRVRDGVFAIQDLQNGISGFKGTLSDGQTPAITGNDQVSCGGCHNTPYRDAGAGTNFAKKSGVGRNSPHFYGSGIMEMLAWQIRQKMMQQMDTNRDNWIAKSEMNNTRIRVESSPGGVTVDYGISADANGDGWPDLNNIFRVWFVDINGMVIDGAESLYDPDVAGYNFFLEVFGWGESQFNLNGTNRIFCWDPLFAHGGLDAHDPTTAEDPDYDGFSQVSNAGFQQSWIAHIPPDPGNNLTSKGLSTDDPDGDGYIAEITEGDLDLMEWYLLNSPRPGRGRNEGASLAGLGLFKKFECNSCHVLNWQIEPADLKNPDIHQRYSGDLRFFDMDVHWDMQDQRLEGQLERLYAQDPVTGEYIRNRDGFLVKGLGTDFKHHDMGPDFHDLQYDGNVVSKFRTAPLWGNGHSYPWGHDGNSMSLDDVIRRHGGDAQASRDAYVAASKEQKEAVLMYLRSMVLYSTDLTPMDIDGNGVIEENFMVEGRNTGVERFNPEWLFRVPGQIEGVVTNPQGRFIRCDQILNVRAAYGLDLPGLMDRDNDGFPDIVDDCPDTTGYKNGCN